jgi:hypothetical protein
MRIAQAHAGDTNIKWRNARSPKEARASGIKTLREQEIISWIFLLSMCKI